ncbi:MAG: protein-glutamine gamma-glutamyltransferase [Solirubrobacteraceae bacterium]|nr:protein-glutamine gamma-glutamyltransferase [Solirubrobacteraceae bacterium]
MSALASPAVANRATAWRDPTFSPPAARCFAFALLATFGALHWMGMLSPTGYTRAWDAVLVSLLAIAGLLGARRLGPRLRVPAAMAVSVVAFGLALLAGGVADELLRPDRWGELASGIDRGLAAIPGASVPYRGLDQWTRTVLGVGGTVLALLAALVAFWPRRSALGFRHAGLFLLVTLYVVPAIALNVSGEFLRGALLVVLVLAYLRLESLRVGDTGAAAALAIGVAVLGLIAAPALDSSTPWFDYESWALDTAASKTDTYSWDHTYGPLNWPRDGRELLRVKAKTAAYWKAANLDEFDGHAWIAGRQTPNADGCSEDAIFSTPQARIKYLQNITVSVRNLRTPTFITAGIACAIDDPRVDRIPLGDGTYASIGRPLGRGDAYSATVYTPNPLERERRLAGTFYPQYLQRYTRITLPGPGPDPRMQEERSATDVQFPLWGSGGAPLATPTNQPNATPARATRKLLLGPYGRTYQLARDLRLGSRTQEDFVERVERYLGRGFSYSETPPPAATNLDGFLFDAKIGYCQQFSGAMALLLRMGGVPARVSTGFTSGSYDRTTREYVVRDFDAHSWVEVWYPSYGWVTFDPTPAAAPARSQPSDGQRRLAGGRAAGAPDLGGDIRSDPSRRKLAAQQGLPWELVVLFAAIGIGLAGLALGLVIRHRRRIASGWGPLAELEFALRRTRRAPRPGTTLQSLEPLLARTPAAAGYVRALREQRYGTATASPTPAGRRALRAELGRGQGLAGRLRAWWALPPRPR